MTTVTTTTTTTACVECKHQFPLVINLLEQVSDELQLLDVSPLQPSFDANGFVIIENVLDGPSIHALNDRLEEVLRGRYDCGRAPDKQPRLLKGELRRKASDEHERTEFIAKPTRADADRDKNKGTKKKTSLGPLGFSGNLQNVRVLQVINIHKSDKLFRALATSRGLGKVVAQLAGWKNGARLAQDQVWAKPPGAAPLVFHRDNPYFMFTPSDVVTVWIALDDMHEELGPLEYVCGSHLWGDGRVGSSNQFFQSKNNSLLQSAAEREGICKVTKVSTAGLGAGGLSIHDGRTWHGSGKNTSRDRPRRGVGLHFVPAEVRFRQDANKSRLWKPYVEHAQDASLVDLSPQDFPITWQP